MKTSRGGLLTLLKKSLSNNAVNQPLCWNKHSFQFWVRSLPLWWKEKKIIQIFKGSGFFTLLVFPLGINKNNSEITLMWYKTGLIKKTPPKGTGLLSRKGLFWRNFLVQNWNVFFLWHTSTSKGSKGTNMLFRVCTYGQNQFQPE